MADWASTSVVAEARCRYLAPLRFDEEIEIVVPSSPSGDDLDDHDLHRRARR